MHRYSLAAARLCVMVFVCGLPAVAAAQDSQTKTVNLTAYAELLRSDIRLQKVAIITDAMESTAAEAAAFCSLSREYDGEMSKLGDERVALVAEYARNYEKLTDDVADRL